MSFLDKINDYTALKKLDYKQKKILAQELRDFLIKLAQTKEIHLSSNLGIVELTIGILSVFNLLNDVVIYDTGHQTYIHKILTGRKDKIHTIREEGGISGLLDMNESIYDHYSPGHSGNAISVLEGMYEKIADINKDPKKQHFYNKKYHVVVVGDSSISNGISFEALNDVGAKRIPLIIIINDNGMSISKATGTFSKTLNALKTSKSFFQLEKWTRKLLKYSKVYYRLFNFYQKVEFSFVHRNIFQNLNFEYIGPIDGHNSKKIEIALNKARWYSKQGPVVVHIKTTKGKGLKKAEIDKEGNYHSNSLKEQVCFGQTAADFLESKLLENQNLRILNPAMNLGTGFNEIYKKEYPHYFDTGISEEHTVSYASGMVLSGLKVYLIFYSTFLQRSYDQLIHDLSRLKLNLTFLIDRADLSGGDGQSHHGIFDIAYLKTVPYTTICSPRNKEQFLALLNYSYKNDNLGIFCIRYPKKVFTTSNLLAHSFEPKKWEWMIDNQNSTCIISYGPYIDLIANKILAENLDCDLVNAIFINHYDAAEIKKLFKQYKKIICYERIYGKFGLVHDLYEYKSHFNLTNEIISLSYNDFVGHGSTNGMDKRSKMDLESLISKI